MFCEESDGGQAKRPSVGSGCVEECMVERGGTANHLDLVSHSFRSSKISTTLLTKPLDFIACEFHTALDGVWVADQYFVGRRLSRAVSFIMPSAFVNY